MRRLAFVSLAAAIACGEISELEPGPRDRFYFPVGIGVHDRKLIVASSNFELRYDDATGGSVIAVDPATSGPTLVGTVNIQSFAGEMAIADPAVCSSMPAGADALALVPVRGENLLYRIPIGAGGALSCNGCALSLAGGAFSDPFAVGVACGPGMARAYVGYLRSTDGRAHVTQVDLSFPDLSADGAVQHASFAGGQARGFAYDEERKRLYVTQTATGAAGSLRYIDLADGCRIDEESLQGGCRGGVAAAPNGVELRAIALARAVPGAPRRAYVTARIYDDVTAAAAGVRVGDFDGLLLVVDLVDGVDGRTTLRIVDQLPIGYGASSVVVLPAIAGRRDVVAALAVDYGFLWLYDDETGASAAIGLDPDSGHPVLGAVPTGLAVDPVTDPGDLARLYVGSFRENFVTRIDVPLLDIDLFDTWPYSANLSRITGGTP